MATNGASKVEDTEMTECDDGEKVVTMMDVLQEQQDFEEDAKAVLGASDDMNCTYSKGYIKRQAIYACLTCCVDARHDENKRAGVCLACSLHCHENHELIELYTKRNFRCDCGNPKFNSNPCTFTPNKTDLNLENNYNQNFSGIYCVCHRPYPDPENTNEEEMIQCIICEDWLHANHLDAIVPSNDQYSEMVCKACMEKNEFLHDYSSLAVNVEVGDIDVTSVNDSLSYDTANNTLSNGDSPRDSVVKSDNEMETDTSLVQSDEKDQPTTESNQDNGKADIQPESEKVAEDKHETESCAKTEEENGQSSNEVNTTSETNPTASEINEKVENTNIDEENDSNKNDEIQNVSDDKDKENAPKGENDDSKPNKDTTEVDKIDSTNKLESINEVERQFTEMHNEPEVENVETQSESETPMHTESIESKVVCNESTTDVLKDLSDDKITNSDSITDTNKPDCTDTNKSDEITSADDTCLQDDQNSTNNDNTQVNALKINDNLTKGEEADSNTSEKRKLNEDSHDTLSKKPKLDSQCLRPKNVKRIHKGATFWPSSFRQKLCTCNECITMYKDLSVLFLLDPEDTVSAYETLGKEKAEGEPSTQYEKGLKALSSLDRIQQINALTEYNKMRDKLLDFLKSFKDKKEVVKEEDIRAFFAGMKPKREPDGVYFCR